ncbi:MAG: hypothetical protein M3Y42_03350 [Actinomycetota bacterium]|nr:hypothetical protein [Actinomycetota bacterium]MDQ2955985.1 hypothetical protein [Actinomycetota bacterium]
MNGDVLDVLRRADPARDSSDYDDARIDRQVTRILQAHAEPRLRPPRSRIRRIGVPTAAFLTVAAAGLGTAAAAGWLSPQARNAFDSPAARQSLRQLYGSTADLDQARERVTAPGPDGSVMATWTVPVGDRGTCTTILLSKKSAALPIGASQRTDLPLGCTPIPAAGQVQHSIRFTALEWRSRTSGTDYLIYSGPLGLATQMQLRLASGTRLTATTHDGYYLLPSVPTANLTCAALIGLDPAGHQVGLASYLTAGCPGDPYQPAPAATQAGPGTTITENSPSQAVSYADGVDVIIDTVIRQDPSRGVGSAASGMSLVTVRLQFYRQSSPQPSALPTSVSFDLLYGDSHKAAADPGKHPDPDLNGTWNPPHPGIPAWWPQRSFDVPTDQLAKLKVRINGDASHPTIIFGSVHVQGSP